MKHLITLSQSKRLTQLETIIYDGVWGVGKALMEIRDEKLWRASHDSFEEYCKSKWGWGRSRAEQLITAFKVVASLPEHVTNCNITEGQAREIAKVEPERRVKVLEDAAAKGKVTAKAIREAANPEPEDPPRVVAHFEVMKPEAVTLPALPPGTSTVQQLKHDLVFVEIQIKELETKRNQLQDQLRKTILALPSAMVCNDVGCRAVFETEFDAVTLYECAECGVTFAEEDSADGCSNRCSSCNKFAAKLTDLGCPECGQGELVKPEAAAPVGKTEGVVDAK